MKLNWSNIPFAPARLPFFYGWVLLGVATIGIVCSIPGQTMGVGIFTDALIDVLGLTRSELSLAYALGTIGSGLFLTRAGKGVDRFGIRPMAVMSSVGLGFSLIFLANLPAISAAIPFRGTLAPMLAVFFCFLFLRFFGQGCLTMVSRVAIGKWFNRYRGRAVAIMGVFTAFSFNSSPSFLNYLLNAHGWQGAAVVLAAITGLGMTAVALLFFRDTPEACGLPMDGIKLPENGDPPPGGFTAEPRAFTLAEARRTLAFWAYTAAPAAQGLVMTAITFHMASLGAEAGLDRAAAYAVFVPMAFFSVGANVVGGWLSDRIHLKWLLGFMMAMQMVGMAGLADLGSPIGRWAFILGHGFAGGLFATMSTVPFPRFYGRRRLGAISGLSMSVMVYASAAGPYLFSKGHDLFGSYRAVTLGCLVLPAIIILLGWIARDPQETCPDPS